MQKLLKAICPEMPNDRTVAGTRDVVLWYKINIADRKLYVPPINVLKINMMELDRFCEAVTSFAKIDFERDLERYNWSDDYIEFTIVEGSDIAKYADTLRKACEESATPVKLACDIETRRVEWEDNKLLAIGIAYAENEVIAFKNIPIAGASGYVDDFGDTWQHMQGVWEALRRLFATPNARFVWHNGKFDCGRLKYLCNIDARIDDDTMLKHYMCINEKKGTHGLKELGRIYLQAPAWDDELDAYKREYCKKNKVKLSDFMYDSIPVEVLLPYLSKDCIATYRLDDLFDKLMRPGSEFMYRQLIRAANTYLKVELAGQRIDVDYLGDLEAELDKIVAEYTAKLDKVTPEIWNPLLYSAMTGSKVKPDEKFNPGSPKQLKWMLEQVLGYPVPSTDAVMLDNLLKDIERGAIKSPIAKDFIEAIGGIRKHSKYLKTYALGIRDVLCADHRVRCTFNLHGTETGRLSSSGPNMQNIPRNKMIKNLIVATPGWKFLQLDYSQAELRVLAMLSEDPALTKIYQDGKDLHDAVADMMFGEGGHKDKELRNLAKTINFGIAYGRGPSSIAEKFGKSMAESRAIIEKWFAPMPKVREFINERRKMAGRGEPCVTMLGRERHFVVTNEDLNHIQNEYINTPIQSLASDFTMLSLLDIYDYLEANHRGKARITTTVHDSIILEVVDGDPELMKTVATDCINIMAGTPLKYVPDCVVPFVADAEVGYKWGEMFKMDMETGLEKVKED